MRLTKLFASQTITYHGIHLWMPQFQRKKQMDNSSGGEKKKKIKNANNGIRVSHGVKFDIRIIILNPELFKKKKLVGKEECKDKSHKLFSKIRKNHIEEGLNTVFYSILE